jgi:hypothetical protein
LVPARAGRQRFVAELDPDDFRRYSRAVARAVPVLEATLGPEVIANRARTVGEGLALTPWHRALRRFNRSVNRIANRHGGPVVVADVAECYPSMQPAAIDRALRAAGCSPALAAPILELIERFRADGIRGLPVGPEASALLANAVLSGADAAIRRAGARHFRWVDDFVVFVPERTSPATVLDGLASSLGAAGLSLNEAKTRVLGPGELGAERLGARSYL